jgi:hypothetical protein
MTKFLRNGALVFATVALAASACQKKEAAEQPAAAAAGAAGVALPVAQVQVCTLLSAAEASAIFGKTVVATGSGRGCQYGLDPAEKEKQMNAMTGGAGKSGGSPANMGALAQSMAKGGGFQMPSAISDQLTLDVSLSQDNQSEDQVKAIYSGIGKTVHGTLEPEKHGLNNAIEVGKEVPGVGEWAFVTNVASVNMGPGMSIRGRLLEGRQGPWRITVSVTISPDPGEAKLDEELGAVARTVVAKLKA